MTSGDIEKLGPLVLLSAASGARSMTGIAAVTRVNGKLATPVALLALGELLVDKSPNVPDRVSPGPLIGRTVAGAIVGAALAQAAGESRQQYAAIGAGTAFLATHLSFHARRVLDRAFPSLIAALVEDVAVLSIATLGTRMAAAQLSEQSP